MLNSVNVIKVVNEAKGVNLREREGRGNIVKKLISFLIVGIVMATGLAVASPASAQEVSRNVTITRDSKCAGQTLTKGDYSIKFVEGKDGELVLLKGKKEVLKASYKWTKLPGPAGNNAVAYDAGSDGSFLLRRIEFKGKADAIVIQ